MRKNKEPLQYKVQTKIPKEQLLRMDIDNLSDQVEKLEQRIEKLEKNDADKKKPTQKTKIPKSKN